MIFLEYPPCSTCKKAKKWLDGHGVAYEDRHNVQNPPSCEAIKERIGISGMRLKKFFNTSGLKYKELGLKDRLPSMGEEEQIALLASDGMLVKRPLVVMDDQVLVGFKEAEWEKAFETVDK